MIDTQYFSPKYSTNTVEPVYIADTFSRNGPNHGQTLIEIPLYSGQFYSGHLL